MNKIVDFFIRVTTTGILIFTFFLTLPVNIELQPRDEVFLNLEKITQYEINLSAKKYCADTLKDNFGKIHCGTTDSQFLKVEERERDKLALIELNNALIAYKSLERKIRESNNINSQLVNVLSATENKIFQIEKLLTEPAGNLHNFEYHEIFKGLLIAQGTSYNPYTNRFKALPQNLAQYVISQSEVKRQLRSLEIISNNLHYFFGVLVLISLLLLKGRLKNLGYLLVSFYFLCVFFGLTITRDASLHFGIESSLFDLSPFRQILERQLNISTLAIIVPNTLLRSKIMVKTMSTLLATIQLHLRDCLTKNNRGQKWYQSIGLPLSFDRKRFHIFLFSRHLVLLHKIAQRHIIECCVLF
jgi:hypothetical protein